MESVESFRGERCGIDNCRSRRYHQNDEGTYECENGHVHSQIRVQGEDEDAFQTASGRVTRTGSGSEVRDKVTRLFEGKKGFELFLQCYQLLVRKQCSFLIKSKGFPEEFETVLRNLWTFRLQALPHRIDEINTIASDSESQSQLFSSQSDTEDDASNATRARRAASTPRLIDSLGLLCLASLLLRLPILPSDILRWALSGELLYYGARSSTPRDMLARLPGVYHALLEPRRVPSIDALNAAVKDLALFYRRDFGMRIPALNLPPLLLRCMEELALPLPVYAVVVGLRSACECDLNYEDWERGRGRKVTQASMPSAQLAGLLVIATKLLYPMDDIERRPASAADPAVLSVDWEKWVEVMRRAETTHEQHREALSYVKAMDIREPDVWDMSRKDLDEYMDFYADNWTNDYVDEHSRDAGARRELLNMFPMPQFPGRQQEQQENPDPDPEIAAVSKVQEIVANLKVNTQYAGETTDTALPPGSYYRQWRKEQDLNDHAKAFCEEVGKTVGISVPRLIRAVFYLERRMGRWSDSLREQDGHQ